MAAILDPKTRFFDTYLTKEGRRQLANGEIRMRFVSFSDGLTGYHDDGDRVIDSKDGSVFFEAMSRPQDQLVTENPSVVNMMEIRDGGEQPTFLFNDDGTRIQASMFGDAILTPPDGKEVSFLTTAGIDKIETEYDPLLSFYVSGSDTQELEYNPKYSGLKGWWTFDSSVDQLATVSNISVESSNIDSLNPATTVSFAGNNVPAFTTGTSSCKVFGISAPPRVGDLFRYGGFTAKISACSVSTDQNKKTYNLTFANKSGTQIISDSSGTIGAFLIKDAKVSQNLSSSSGLSTNAAYMKFDNSEFQIPDDSPVFASTHMQGFSKDEKSYEGATKKFIRINLQRDQYNFLTESTLPAQHGSAFGGGRFNRLSVSADQIESQISVWFYLKPGGNDGFAHGGNQTILQLWDGRDLDEFNFNLETYREEKIKKVELVAVTNDLKLYIYDSSGVGTVIGTIEDALNPSVWHRVSIAWNHNYIFVVLDGDLRKSIRRINAWPPLTTAPGNNQLSVISKISDDHFLSGSISDVILGNSLAKLANKSSVAPNDTYIRGYIQECQYFSGFMTEIGTISGAASAGIFQHYVHVPAIAEGFTTRTLSGYRGENYPILSKVESYDFLVYDLNTRNHIGGGADKMATGEIKVRNVSEPSLGFESNSLKFSLVDASGKTVNFIASSTGMSGNSWVKVDNSNFKFSTVGHSFVGQEGGDNQALSTSDLASNLHNAITAANSDTLVNLGITSSLEDNTVSLTQVLGGESGNTAIPVYNETSSRKPLKITNFSGGSTSGNLLWKDLPTQ